MRRVTQMGDDVPEDVSEALPSHEMEFTSDSDDGKHKNYACVVCGLTAYYDPFSGFVGGPARAYGCGA